MKKSILSITMTIAALVIVSCYDEPVTPGSSNGATTGRSVTDQDASADTTGGTVVQYTYESLRNGTVRVSFTNTTGHTLTGDIIREGVSYLQNGSIITFFSVAPGETYSYIDDDVVPNETYRYILEYRVGDTSGYEIFFDNVTVVSDVPALGHFILIAGTYDDEYETLRNGYNIVLACTNIKVEANADLTGSVEFFLNGKRYKDNEPPFSVFGDRDGQYKNGDLENGSYTLTAIAYPEKNGKGIPGDTATVNFTVDNIYYSACQ